MKRKFIFCFIIVLTMFATVNLNSGLANERASLVFDSTTVALSSSLYAEFKASTKYVVKKIEITSCLLQKMDDNGNVISSTSVSRPSAVTNDDDYHAYMRYSSVGVRGNRYRIKATFKADGVTATAYSRIVDY